MRLKLETEAGNDDGFGFTIKGGKDKCMPITVETIVNGKYPLLCVCKFFVRHVIHTMYSGASLCVKNANEIASSHLVSSI